MKKLFLQHNSMGITWISCLLIMVSVGASRAQTVSGTVRSSIDNQPLPGVTVHVSSANRGTVTDNKGRYQLSGLSSGDTLVFSFVGFEEIARAVGSAATIDVKLHPVAASLDQVVVIGYGTAKKKDLTGSIAQINPDDFKNQAITQVTGMLAGTVAGFSMDQGTSAEGGGSSLLIRGPNSLTAQTDPLIVVDGAIYFGSISDINPSDIASIDILKDASSAAVYGAKAASGVILITTKRGKTGKPTIHFSSKIGFAEPAHDRKPLNAREYLQFRGDYFRTINPDKPYDYYSNPNDLPSGVTIDQWRNYSANPNPNDTLEYLNRLRFFPTEREQYLAGKTTDWYDIVMQKGLRQSYDLSISGGSEKFHYYWSVGYDNNEGVIVSDKFSTTRTRLNVDFKVTHWLDVGMNTQFANRNQNGIPASLSSMYVASPYGKMYDADTLKWYPHDHTGSHNPLINTYNQKKYHNTINLFSSAYAKVSLPFGIQYKLSFQPRLQFSKDYNFWGANTITGASTHIGGYGTRNTSSLYGWILDNLITWNKQIGIHHFDLTLLYSAEENKSWSTDNSNETFSPNDLLGYHGLQFGINPSLSNNDTKSTGDALMARLNYSLLDRYLLTLSIRRDGYSAFGQKHPRANFPAAAIAWRISNENFFNVDWIDDMKLRLSYGVNGNRDIGIYSALAQVGSNLYYNGSATQVGVYTSSLANPDLVWERTGSMNIGLDLTLLDNKVSLSTNYYNMTTTNLLVKRRLPALTGFSSVLTNIGQLSNRGFEISVNTMNLAGPDFSWSSALTFSFNRNKIDKLFGDYEEVTVNGQTIKREVPDYSNNWFPGQPIDVVWDYNVIGIWQTSEKDKAASYGMRPGGFKAEDVNGDGKYVELDDKQFIGYSRPRYHIGLRNQFTFFKRLTASLFLRAELGYIGAYSQALNGGSENDDRRNRNVGPVPYWTPENPINDYARLDVNTSGFGGGLMIYRPRSFVRIQDFSLAYTFAPDLIEKVKLNSARIFCSVRNLYAFDNWPGWDPESGNQPMPRIYTFGIDLSL